MRFTFLILTFLSSLSIEQARAETLADAMIAAYQKSNLLEKNRALLRAADEDLASVVAYLRPIFKYSATNTLTGKSKGVNSNSSSLSFDLSGSIDLYDFGRGKLAKYAAQELVLGARSALIGVEQSVLLATVNAFVDERLAQEAIKLRKNNYRLINQEFNAAKARYDVGEVTQTDVAIAQARLAASRSNLAAAEGDFLVAREAYKAATGAYPNNVSDLPELPQLPATLADAIALARANNVELAAARHVTKISEIGIESARVALRPTLKAGASATFDNNVNIYGSSASVTLSQTIYSGGALASNVRKAVSNHDGTQASLRQVAVGVEQTVANNWSALRVAQAGIEAAKLQIEASQTAYDGVREEASLGARTSLDVLNAEQDLLDAKDASLSAESRFYKGTYQLLASVGKLTVEHLKLDIPTYDVSSYYSAVKQAPLLKNVQSKKLDKFLKTLGGN